MSRTHKNHTRPTKFMLLSQEVEGVEAVAQHYEQLCLTTSDPKEKRECYCRMQDTKQLLLKKSAALRKLKHRCKPAPPMPLFQLCNKEVS